MRKLMMVFIGLSVVVALVSCTSKTSKNGIVGTWVNDKDIVIFYSDGTFSSQYYFMSGNYIVDDDKLTMSILLSENEEYKFNIKDDTLTMKSIDGNNFKYVLKRNTSSELETKDNNIAQSEADAHDVVLLDNEDSSSHYVDSNNTNSDDMQTQSTLEDSKAQLMTLIEEVRKSLTEEQKSLLQYYNNGWTYSKNYRNEKAFYYMGQIGLYPLANYEEEIDMYEDTLVFMNDKAYFYGNDLKQSGLKLYEIDFFNNKVNEILDTKVFEEYGVWSYYNNRMIVCDNHLYTYANAATWCNLLEINPSEKNFSFVRKIDNETCGILFSKYTYWSGNVHKSGVNYIYTSGENTLSGYYLDNYKMNFFNYNFITGQLQHENIIDVSQQTVGGYENASIIFTPPNAIKVYMWQQLRNINDKTGFTDYAYQLLEYDPITSESKVITKIKDKILSKRGVGIITVIDNWIFLTDSPYDSYQNKIYKYSIKDDSIEVYKGFVNNEDLKFDFFNTYFDGRVIPHISNGTPIEEYNDN